MRTDAAPRARLALISVRLTPSELSRLIFCLTADAEMASRDEQFDYADFLHARIVALREAAR